MNCRVTEDSSTPLHKACAGSKPGHLNAVKLLLEYDADVHALNKWRETPLLTAANHGQAGAVEALLRAGADPCKCTDTGWSPLSIAAYKGHDDVVRLLLEEGAPTEEADPTLSALLQAATKGLPGTVELLLKHGADHTVTTKKGDTALSILVEQNLIDAAVEMVTAYKASVPRCSRDRKKVQRARLLINLRVKQQQKEGKLIVSDDDDETDDENSETKASKAQHFVAKDNGGAKKTKKMTAEEQAKLAEEALLFELEQEDAKRNKEVQEANKKSAKKRKKKERERQQKKEQEEKRLAEEREKKLKEKEEREAKERADKKRRDEEEKKRQQQYREQQRKEQQQRELQRKEQQQRELQQKEEQRLKAQQQQYAAKNPSPPAGDKKAKTAKAKTIKPQQQIGLSPAPAPVPTISKQESTQTKAVGMAPNNATPSKTVVKPNVQPAQTATRAAQTGKNRGWETKQPAVDRKKPSPKTGSASSKTPELGSNNSVVLPSSSGSPGFSTPGRPEKALSTEFFPQPANSPFANQQAVGEISGMLNPKPTASQAFNSADSLLNGLASTQYPEVEVPAVALFRRDKVTELLQRCSVGRNPSDALSVVSEATIRNVLYRWMVRSAHDLSPVIDSIIPSWHDFDQLNTFFQRQFISESRKGVNPSVPSSAVLSMESLKEAGTAMALMCHSLAKDISDFCRRVGEQLQNDWVDSSISMTASMQNGAGSLVYLTWANRSQVSLPALSFNRLRERYTGPQSRILSAIFSAKIRHEAKQLLVNSRSMDICLPTDTQSVLSVKASVSAELWSNPFLAPSGNMFWGQFADVDTLFGGLAPFSKESGGEDLLIRHGGSVSAVLPMDNMVASRYVHRMVDILDQTTREHVPVSFAVFCRAECFLDWNNAPSVNDLFMLDTRLRDGSNYVVKVEQLLAEQHCFLNERTGKIETSSSGSLFFVLQNEAGRSHYGFNDAAVAEIIRSMGGNVPRSQQPKLLTPMSFSAPEFVPSQESQSFSAGYFDSHQPHSVSPIRQHTLPTDFGQQSQAQQQQQPLDFGAIGGTTISNAFAAAPASGGRRARGRLFDLVDDGEEDQLNDVDVVSGMLGNLNVDLFHNTNGGDQVVDIEAISLMGIGGPPQSGGLQPRNSRGRFG